MNYALHRSEIGEVWIQPSLLKEAPKLYLVPSPDLKSKPAKKRRERGEGSGCIVMRYCTKKGKSYEQYWYDYELWKSGVCLRKGSVYIPKKLIPIIDKMEQDKQPVKEILNRLSKRV
jgi:hypothetical protein